MKIQDILQKEDDNTNWINLFKEGIFYRAFDKSAYIFVRNIKAYQLKSKYYKNINRDVVYIGFPATYLDRILEKCKAKNFSIQKQEESEIVLSGEIETEGYEVWKEEIINAGEQTKTENRQEGIDILREISAYPLASKTPMEAQQFLHTIQIKMVHHKDAYF